MIELAAAVAVAGLVYPTLRRWDVWRWLAALATGLGALGAVLLGDPRTLPCSILVAAAVWLLTSSVPPSGQDRWLGAALLVGALPVWWYLDPDWPPAVDRPGAVPAVLAVVALTPALLAVAGVGRAAAAPMRWVCLLTALVAALGIATLGSALVSWCWLPGAGALGLTALLRGRRDLSASARQTDEVDEELLALFAREHPGLVFPRAVIVIAAYNEAVGIPAVLASLPREVPGLAVAAEVLVVDDGSTDGTAGAARASGRGYVVACPTNRGQGRALRLGYRIARDHGAEFVATTDADGQYSPDEIADVLTPVVEGRADFVTGSRRRGRLENKDPLRRAGTYVFAWVASLLLDRRITDTSFGLRAMRVEVTEAVTLNEPQYQASELLVGVVSHGFRLLEVPGTMRARSAGASKKGGNLRYGARYAGVMLGTWWREGCPRPVAETASALRGSTRHARHSADARA